MNGTRFEARIYGWALATRAIAGLSAYFLTLYTEVPFLEDALWYEEEGYRVATHWLSGGSGGLDQMSESIQMAWFMVAAIAVLYYVMAGIRALPLLLVLYSAVTALVPVYIYSIGRQLGASEKAARQGAWLVALSPVFVFWSGSLYKEGLILLVLSVVVYHTLRLQSRWRGASFALIVLGIAALYGLRFYLAALMTMVLAAGLLWTRGRDRVQRADSRAAELIRQAVIAAVFIGLVTTLGLTERAERRLTESPEGVLVEIDRTRYWLARSAQSGYLPEAEVSTPGEAVQFFPIGLLYFLTVPFPWQTGGIRQNLIIPETAFWVLALYPLIGLGLARGLRVNRAGTFVIVAATAGMCAIYALLSGNVGTAYRMRSQVWLLWAPFAAWGWEIWRERRRQASNARLVERRQRRLAPRSR